MRVLHVIPSVADRDGGPTVALHQMVQGLTELGLEISVATTRPRGASSTPSPASARGPSWHMFRRSLPGRWKFSWPLTRWLRDHVTDFHVVHVHALFSYATIPACRLSARNGIPYVLRPLGTLDPWSLRHKAWKKGPYFRMVERAHLRGAAAIHATSAAEARALRRLGFRDTVRVVPLGVRAPAVPAAVMKGEGEVCQLLFLSRIHEKKGLPLLLRALARLPHRDLERVRLLVAGDGRPAYVRRIHWLAKELGLAERVTFLGFVTGEAKARLFREADIFVLPSHTENFGLAAAEALAVGLPVILSDRVAIAEDVRAAGAGIVVPQNFEALSVALSRLVRDADLRSLLGRRGTELARECFSWETTCLSLTALYERIRGRRLTTERGRWRDSIPSSH